MASCSKCKNGQGQVLCGGCQQWSCLRHFGEHREDLRGQMDDLTYEHDQLHEYFIDHENIRIHPLMTQVDQWEMKIVEKIRHIANEVRQRLGMFLHRLKENMEESLHFIAEQLRLSQQINGYTEIDLNKWRNQLEELKDKFGKPSMVEIEQDDDERSSTHLRLIQLRIIQREPVFERISHEKKWLPNGKTIAGGHEQGNALNQLSCPFGLDVDNDGTLFIADTDNHRIMRWKPNATQGEIIAGGKGKGNRTDQLNEPAAVLIDRLNDGLIINDWGNRRVMRWSLKKYQQNDAGGEVIIRNIDCVGLAMDNQESLYVCDFEKHEVRRFGLQDGREGVVVAGGHGPGAALNQLNSPRHVFVDNDQSVYVSDGDNDRVMKWMKNATVGVVVAGGRGRGNSFEQLSRPSGIFIDQMGSVYVVDKGNHRVIRWLKDASEGKVIMGGHGPGSQDNQLNDAPSMSLDGQGNLYVVDQNNHRIQRFDLKLVLETDSIDQFEVKDSNKTVKKHCLKTGLDRKLPKFARCLRR